MVYDPTDDVPSDESPEAFEPPPPIALDVADFAANLPFRRSRRVFHKPTRSGAGSALQVELRLAPRWVALEKGGGFFDRQASKDGGCFLELVPQIGVDEQGNARFGWGNEETMLRAKLGVPDLSALLTAMREVRWLGREVPPALRGSKGGEWDVSLFHKVGQSATVITYTFEEAQSVLRISKSKDHWRTISLQLHEELVLQRYLEHCLDAYLIVGKR